MDGARCHQTISHRFHFQRGHDRDAQFSKRQSHECHESRWTDRPLAADQEPPRGTHLVTPRRGYVHHGIYVGDGTVVHYRGLSRGLRRGPVEEVSLAHFANGRPISVRHRSSTRFERDEVVSRARSRVGEDCYRLFTNNCEHFCEWCLHGEARSQQVESWLSEPRRVLHAARSLVARVLVIPSNDGCYP